MMIMTRPHQHHRLPLLRSSMPPKWVAWLLPTFNNCDKWFSWSDFNLRLWNIPRPKYQWPWWYRFTLNKSSLFRIRNEPGRVVPYCNWWMYTSTIRIITTKTTTIIIRAGMGRTRYYHWHCWVVAIMPPIRKPTNHRIFIPFSWFSQNPCPPPLTRTIVITTLWPIIPQSHSEHDRFCYKPQEPYKVSHWRTYSKWTAVSESKRARNNKNSFWIATIPSRNCKTRYFVYVDWIPSCNDNVTSTWDRHRKIRTMAKWSSDCARIYCYCNGNFRRYNGNIGHRTQTIYNYKRITRSCNSSIRICSINTTYCNISIINPLYLPDSYVNSIIVYCIKCYVPVQPQQWRLQLRVPAQRWIDVMIISIPWSKIVHLEHRTSGNCAILINTCWIVVYWITQMK